MCGLVHGKRKNGYPIANAILKRFDKQRSRGTEGFGYVSVENGYIKNVVRAETETEIKKRLKNEKASEILFHHRRPTSTPNYKELAHPIVVKNKLLDYDYYIIHNGVIRNSHELKRKHEEKGFEYQTEMTEITTTKIKIGEKTYSKESSLVTKFNDSEALATELALFFDGKKGTIDTQGAVAFIAYQTRKDGKVIKMHYGKNTINPLTVENNGDLYFIRSEGGKYELESNRIITLDYETGERTVKVVDVGKGYSYQNWNKKNETSTPALPARKEVKEPEDLEDDKDYYWSEDHLASVREEIICLKVDLEDCDNHLEAYPEEDDIPPKEINDYIYWTQYKDEVEDKLEEKEQMANSIMDYLEYMKPATHPMGFS